MIRSFDITYLVIKIELFKGIGLCALDLSLPQNSYVLLVDYTVEGKSENIRKMFLTSILSTHLGKCKNGSTMSTQSRSSPLFKVWRF